jgi:predicted GIY-YIG superfamily endonuclease
VITLLNDRHGRQESNAAYAVDFLEQPGVYVLYREDIPYYIGKATNLRRRLLTHTRLGNRYANHWNHISIFVIHDEAHRSAVESILIASFPSANSAKPRIKRIPLPAKALKKWQKQKGASGS